MTVCCRHYLCSWGLFTDKATQLLLDPLVFTATRRCYSTTPQPEICLLALMCACAFFVLPFRRSSERDKMGHQQLYWSHPRKFGQGSRSWSVPPLLNDTFIFHNGQVVWMCLRPVNVIYKE